MIRNLSLILPIYPVIFDIFSLKKSFWGDLALQNSLYNYILATKTSKKSIHT